MGKSSTKMTLQWEFEKTIDRIRCERLRSQKGEGGIQLISARDHRLHSEIQSAVDPDQDPWLLREWTDFYGQMKEGSWASTEATRKRHGDGHSIAPMGG
jgi:hypothetical protein